MNFKTCPFVAVVLLVSSCLASAQVPGISGPMLLAQPAVSSSYTGPGNITSGATMFWSCGRAYNAAYAAAQSPLCTVVDTATGLVSCTFNAGTNGYANLTALVCVGNTVSIVTFCTVTHAGCSVTEMFDQTGNGYNVTQATLASMPALTLSAQNGLPCASGSGTESLVYASTYYLPPPYSTMAVTERTGNFTSYGWFFLTNSQGLLWGNTANTLMTYNTAFSSLTAADSAPHAMISVGSESTPLFAVDSSANTTTPPSGTAPFNGNIYVTGYATSGSITGYVCESGLWPAALNSSYVAMLANMRSATVGWNF